MPYPKRQPEHLQTKEFIKRVATGPKLAVALALVLFGCLPLLGIWSMVRGRPLDEIVALTLLGVFVFAVIETFAIIILQGMGHLDLPDKFLHWLGAATVGEVATMLLLIVKKLFGSR